MDTELLELTLAYSLSIGEEQDSHIASLLWNVTNLHQQIMILLLADIFCFRVTGVLQKMAAPDVFQADEEK